MIYILCDCCKKEKAVMNGKCLSCLEKEKSINIPEETPKCPGCGEISVSGTLCEDCLSLYEKAKSEVEYYEKISSLGNDQYHTKVCKLCGNPLNGSKVATEMELCRSCFYRMKKVNGGFLFGVENIPEELKEKELKFCNHPNCFNIAADGEDKCIYHLKRKQTYFVNKKHKCEVPGCEYEASCKNLCYAHYLQFKRLHKTKQMSRNDFLKQAKPADSGRGCSFPGCNRYAGRNQEYCRIHLLNPNPNRQYKNFTNDKDIYVLRPDVFIVPLPYNGYWCEVYQSCEGNKFHVQTFRNREELDKYLKTKVYKLVKMFTLINEGVNI